MAKKKQQQESNTPKFYDLGEILGKNADYNLIFGERSNGKTYAALRYGLEQFINTGKQMAYIRRWREDLRGKRAESLFANHTANGLISSLTDGKFNEVFYVSNKWFLSYYNEETGKPYPVRCAVLLRLLFVRAGTRKKQQLPECYDRGI